MSMIWLAVVVLLGFFVALMLFLELGRRVGIYRKRVDPNGAVKGLGAVEGAIFGLMGLLIAFTFSGAGGRFEHRRELITQETNAIGTAWLRLDELPSADQPAMRQLFREYLDARLGIYRGVAEGDEQAARAENNRATQLQSKIWAGAISACKAPQPGPICVSLLPALNDMIDITTTRTTAMENHPPRVVFIMLIAVALVCAMLAGYDQAEAETRNWLHIAGFALIMTITRYVIVDLEYPRIGFIRIDSADHLLLDLRQTMN
jgi:hypothetical protein